MDTVEVGMVAPEWCETWGGAKSLCKSKLAIKWQLLENYDGPNEWTTDRLTDGLIGKILSNKSSEDQQVPGDV